MDTRGELNRTPPGTRRAARSAGSTSFSLAPAMCALASIAFAPFVRAQTTPAPAAPEPIVNPVAPGTISPAEAQRMRDRMTALESENAALKRKLRDLQFELDRARGAVRGGPTANDQHVADVPRDPLASPASLFLELQRRYERDLGDLPRQTDAQIDMFKKRAEKWAAATNQELHGKSRWLARFSEIYEIAPGRFETVVTILDDASFAPIGQPIRLEIPGRYVDRVRSMERSRRREEWNRDGTRAISRDDGPLTWAWEMHVTVAADMKFRPDTPDVGLFNAVDLVGGYVEFGMKLEWQGLTDVEIPAVTAPDEQPHPGQPSRAPASDHAATPVRPPVRPTGDPR